MPFLEIGNAPAGNARLYYRDDGPRDGSPLVFLNALGADLRIWDGVAGHMPGLRLIRYDMRGQGQSACPAPPYTMGALIRDLERLLDHLKLRDCVLVGLALGGLVAQGLAVKRLDLVRGLVLSNTAAKIGTAQGWHDRIDRVRAAGIETIADEIMARWYTPAFRKGHDLQKWRDMLTDQPLDGYIGGMSAMAGTDFYTTTATLTLPTLVIAANGDIATPPDLVRETAGLIRGSRFHLLRGAGHLPCVEIPQTFAEVLNGFLSSIGHV